MFGVGGGVLGFYLASVPPCSLDAGCWCVHVGAGQQPAAS
jgi:hypothetical protein